MRFALLLAAALLGSGCVSIDWEKEAIHRPVPREVAEELRAEQADFGACVERLGAPLEVFELDEGLAIAYGWLRVGEWDVEVEMTIGKVTLSYSFASVDRRMRGLMFEFDEELELVDMRWGWLDDLTEKGRSRRPLDLEELEES